jgi:hypothetical protein
LYPTGKLRAAQLASNPVLVTPRTDGTLGGASVAIARAFAAHLGVPIERKPYDDPARYNENLATDDWDIGLAARDPSRAEHLVFSAAIIAACQAVEHYEITRYGSLIAWAKRLGRNDVATVLDQTLSEEKAADKKLTDIAESKVNLKAA